MTPDPTPLDVIAAGRRELASAPPTGDGKQA